jgi:hypothetical protein
MCDLLAITPDDDLDEVYRNYVGAAKARYHQSAIEALNVALEKIGYKLESCEYDRMDGSGEWGDANYRKGTLELYFSYLGETFIHGYLKDGHNKVNLHAETAKDDPLNINQFIRLLVSKEEVVTCKGSDNQQA